MVKSDTIELFKRIIQLAIWSRQARIHWHALQLGGVFGATNVHAGTFFDVAEIDCVCTSTALVGNHGRLHVTDECPLRCPKERVCLDIRCAGTSAEALGFVFDQ